MPNDLAARMLAVDGHTFRNFFFFCVVLKELLKIQLRDNYAVCLSVCLICHLSNLLTVFHEIGMHL